MTLTSCRGSHAGETLMCHQAALSLRDDTRGSQTLGVG